MVRINSREFRKILHKFFPLVTAFRYYISYEMCNDNNDTSIKSKFLFFFLFQRRRELNIVGCCNGPTEFLKVTFLYSFRFHELEIARSEV